MRIVMLVVLMWGLLAVPTLCTGGLLAHECDCGESLECSHEDECADDPCGDELVPPATDPDDEAPVANTVESSAFPMIERPTRTPDPPPFPLARANLPCPPPSLPLRR